MQLPRALVGLIGSLLAGVLLLAGCDGAKTAGPSTPSQSPPSPTTNQASASPTQPSCGPDKDTALRDALTRYPPEPVTGRGWGPNSQGDNYDPCADLSTILIMVDGGTASSPMQALMFHRGTWLGTGTSRAYSFTSVDSAASTNDTVVLAYRSGQSCSACGDGILTRVRYHWDGNQVQMLDPPPPG
jgi:hypothetical protein